MEESVTKHAIEVVGLTKRFGKTVAVDNLSFTVPCGVIAGFVGPNGAGKTTTIRMLATLLKPDAGTVRVLGLNPAIEQDTRRVRHSIGFMPDYFGLYSDMKAGEYLDFFGAAYSIPVVKRERLVDDILALVNLTDKKDTMISGLSRGMQQKLSLGRALIHSPELLLLDEPASGLDPRARIELMELLRELRNMGKTIFISSHILTELQNLCDMVVIVEKGGLVYQGDIEKASDGVMEGRRYTEVAVTGDPDAAADILRVLADVKEIKRKDRLLLVEHGTALATADIIEACVKGGVRLEEVRRGSANLEEIFMHLTGGEE